MHNIITTWIFSVCQIVTKKNLKMNYDFRAWQDYFNQKLSPEDAVNQYFKG
tara:strand:+ start:469 stop:621 length:153 start_codon:yes stop_codon:yes gene_type:complete